MNIGHRNVEQGATIGAEATIVCGVSLETYSFVRTNAVVTKESPPYTLSNRMDEPCRNKVSNLLHPRRVIDDSTLEEIGKQTPTKKLT